MNTQFEIRQKVILDKIAREEAYLADCKIVSVEGEAAERVGALLHKVRDVIDDRIEAMFEAVNLADEQVEAALEYICAQRAQIAQERRDRAQKRIGRYWATVHRRRREKARAQQVHREMQAA